MWFGVIYRPVLLEFNFLGCLNVPSATHQECKLCKIVTCKVYHAGVIHIFCWNCFFHLQWGGDVVKVLWAGVFVVVYWFQQVVWLKYFSCKSKMFWLETLFLFPHNLLSLFFLKRRLKIFIEKSIVHVVTTICKSRFTKVILEACIFNLGTSDCQWKTGLGFSVKLQNFIFEVSLKNTFQLNITFKIF